MISRRQFLKIAGISAACGIGVAATSSFIKAGASRSDDTRDRLIAKRWGMFIDTRKIDENDRERIINACHSIHNVPNFDNPRHAVKWIWTEEFIRAFPEQRGEFIAEKLIQKPILVLCNNCSNPPCVRVCPTQATFKRERDGLVLMDFHRCFGCRYCMAGCPYGARSFNFWDPRPYIEEINPEFPTRMMGVVEKCSFCYQRIDRGIIPACVEVSNGAMVVGDLSDPGSEIRILLREHITIRRRPELGTEPNVFYKI